MTTSIRVPDTISKLSPDDTYPIVEGADVGGFTDLQNEVLSNTSKIEANIENINSLTKAGKTSIFNNVGDSTPMFPDEPHGNYLVVQRGQSKTVVINMPAPTGGVLDGTLFTLYNESTTYAANLVTVDSSTLKNGSSVIVPPEHFASFVYHMKSSNWLALEEGYLPAARINIANYVEQKLSTDGKIHTEAELETAGFLKGLKVSGDGVSVVQGSNWIHFTNATVVQGKPNQADVTIHGEIDPTEAILHFQTITERDEWSAKEGAKYTKVVCVVDKDENNYVGWYEWNATKWDPYNAQGVIMSDSSGAIPKVIKTAVFGPGFSVQQAGDQEDAALITYAGGGGGTGSPLSIAKDYPDFKAVQDVADIKLLYPLEVSDVLSQGSVVAGEAQLSINPGAYEAAHEPSVLITSVNTKPIKSNVLTTIPFNSPITPMGRYFSYDAIRQGIAVEDSIPDDDPNVSGGELTEILASVNFLGTPPSSGRVRFEVRQHVTGSDGDTSLLLDVHGNPFIVERAYTVGNTFEPLVIAGAYRATSQHTLTLEVIHTFDTALNVDQDTTLLNINQYLLSPSSSISRMQFEERVGTKFLAEVQEFTKGKVRLADRIEGNTHPEVLLSASSSHDVIDQFTGRCVTPIRAHVINNLYTIQSVPNQVGDFYLEYVMDSRSTRMARNSYFKASVTIQQAVKDYELAAFVWRGIPDESEKLYTTRDANGDIELLEYWEKIGTETVLNTANGSAGTFSMTFKIPDDANNVLVAMLPIQAQDPILLTISDFTVDPLNDFIGYNEIARTPLNEDHLIASTSYAEFTKPLTDHIVGLHYTINKNPEEGLPMPCGFLLKGKAPITLDSSYNTVSGSDVSSGEGTLRALEDGEATVSADYMLRNENPADTTVHLWWELFQPDGTKTPIDNSDLTVVVPANTKHSIKYTKPAFTVDLLTGQSIGLRASADRDAGASLSSYSYTTPLVTTVINYRGYSVIVADDPFENVDLHQFDKVYTAQMTATKAITNQSSVTIPMDIPENMTMEVMSAVKILPDFSVRPVNKLDWVYKNADHTLTVSFGETVQLGQITIGIYL